MASAPSSPSEFGRRLALVVTVVLVAVAVVWLLVVARTLLLFVFAGILGAVLLHGAATAVAARLPVGRGVALAGVIVLLGAGVAAFWWVLGGQVAQQVAELERRIPAGLAAAEAWLSQFAWGRVLLTETPAPREVIGREGLVAQLTGVFATAIGLVVNVIVLFTVALYGAASPGLYVDNALKLLPEARRARAREVLDTLARALRSWFFGQLIAMVFVGVVTTVGLTLLGVPLALSLGLMAGLLEFIPYLGPFLAAAPILLVALLEGPETALYVALFLIALQQVESYLVTPLAQRYAVSMPPALLIVGQVLFGLVFGFVGVVFAAPALVVTVVLVQMLYVEDVLRTRVVVLGSERVRPGWPTRRG